MIALQRARREDFTYQDGNIVGSMCTEPHQVAQAAHRMFLETNLGDPGHFPGVAKMEQDVLEDLRLLLHGTRRTQGRFTSGGTEANLLALWLARETTGKTQVVVPESAHFSFEKAARILRMDLKRVALAPDGRADATKMKQAITKKTALVVAVAGSTELGLVDPIREIAAAARAAKVPCHVDAAFGGYVIPFLEDAGHKPRAFDFKLPGVTSLAIDPHKMGMATIPSGVLMLRDGRQWHKITVETPYVSTDGQSTLLGTRSGAAVAACWAVHRHLGFDGFSSVVETCLDNTVFLAAKLEERGIPVVQPPELNVVTFQPDDPAKLADDLQKHHYRFRVNQVPRYGAIRVVVNPHVTRHVIERFLDALDDIRAAT